MTNWQDQYYQITAAAASKAEAIARREYTGALYAVVKPATGNGAWGDIDVIRQTEPVPDGWELLTGERFPAHVPYQNWAGWIRSHAPRIIGSDA